VRQLTRQVEIFFSVPPEFYAHNDLVAAALMAVAGWNYKDACFNFPISARCAELLPRYHRLTEVGPVDPSLEPRRPGRYYGVCFSGGLDSLAMLTLLRDCVGLDVKVITGEYDGFHREAVGYASYRRDVSCHTNFRRVFGDARRFDAAIPLLFADYADLHSFVSGHAFAGIPLGWRDPREGPREFLDQDVVSEAGGLREVHVARCLHTYGLLKFMGVVAPERIELGLHVTAPPGSQKHLVKQMMLRHIYRSLRRPLPPFLNDLTAPRRRDGTQVERLIHLGTAWEWRFLEHPQAIWVDRRIGEVDWGPLQPLSLEFFRKYCPLTAQLMPSDLRSPTLAAIEAAGIPPNTANDYDELEQLRQFILAVNPPGTITFE